MPFGIKQATVSAFYCMITLCAARSYAQDKVNTNTEWELVKYERYKKKLNFSMDSLKLIYRHRWSIGFTFGGLYMPGYTAAEKDRNTRVDMREKHSFYTFSFEYYITNITRVGIEVGWQMLPRDLQPESGRAYVDGGTGLNMPVFIYVKRDVWGGVLNRTTEKLESGKAVNRPSLFIMAAVGMTSTTLVKIRANQEELHLKQYNQSPFTAKLGIGVFQPVGRVIGVELITTYQLSANYSPYIGSVSSYSGFNLSARFSFIGNRKFNKVKRRIDNTY